MAADLAVIMRLVDELSKPLKAASGEVARFDSHVSHAGKVVAGASVAVAGAFAGIGVASVGLAMDFEKSMSGIKAVSGATADEMDGLTKLTLQLGKDTVFSAKEAAVGIEELIKGGVPIADIMNGAARATLNLATAGGVDLASAAEIASNSMAIFNLKGADMEHVADQIAGAANASSLSVTDFKFSMAMAGAVANLSGQSFDSTAQAIAVLGQQGLKGSDAGTSLKTMLMNLQPTTKAQSAAFKALGLDTGALGNAFLNADGSFKQLGEIAGILNVATKDLSKSQKTLALEAIFGSDAIRAAAIIAEAGAPGFTKMATEMNKVTAASVAAERLNNLAGDIEMLKGSVETAGIMIGTAFTPQLRGLTQWVGGLTNKFIELMDKGASPMGAIFQIVQEQLGELAEAFREWVGPASTAMFAKLGELKTNLWNWIQETVPGVIRQLGEWKDAFIDWVRPLIPPLLVELRNMLGRVWGWISDTAPGLVTKFADEWAPAAFEWVGEAIANLVPALAQLLRAIVTWTITTGGPKLVEMGVKLGAALIGGLARALVGIGSVISSAVSGVRLPGGGRLPNFAGGGVVPGAIGAPMLAMVHGGERIQTPAQQNGGGGGGVTTANITVVLDGQVVGRSTWNYLKEQKRNGSALGFT